MLEEIRSPEDLKALDPRKYKELAEEIRSFLVRNVSIHGGHLASNLGVVELTMALHLVYDLPEDKIIWDVGHQSYTHKILTGRQEDFSHLREFGGMSGFPKRRESEYDSFDTGHSSTSISAGLGIAEARDRLGESYSVVSVIGDGALSGGMAYEALNNVSKLKSNFVIVLNDNNMSISESTGGFSHYLSQMRLGSGYNNLKRDVKKGLAKVPGAGESLVENISHAKMAVKQLMVPGMFFENLDVTYIGPIDGHNIPEMVRIFEQAKKIERPVIVHVKTKKGRGYRLAEKYPTRFHGIGPFDVETGKSTVQKTGPTYTDVFSRALCSLAEEDEKIVAVTAAMPEGTGLSRFAEAFPDRFFDVGIAEEHAVTFAAGMAAGGLKPVVAVYSTFMQRAYDQIIHDVCLQNLPVVFVLDRAGLVGEDGETHHGIFDLSYLRSIPGMTVIAPKNRRELKRALRFALQLKKPVAIRISRGTAYEGFGEIQEPFVSGKSEVLKNGSRVVLAAVGSMVEIAQETETLLAEKGIDAGIVNARFVKPLDTALIETLAGQYDLVVTMEENESCGGYGEAVESYVLERNLKIRVAKIAVRDVFVEHGAVNKLRRKYGLDAAAAAELVCRVLNEMKSD